MAVEVWIPVSGHETAYEVSSEGRVRSLERFRDGPYGCRIRVRGRILKDGPTGAGYRKVALGKRNTQLVHRLVASAFLPNPFALPEVNHDDGDKTNNRVVNLEWATHRGNALHASRRGLLATGLRHGRNTQPEAFNGRR